MSEVPAIVAPTTVAIMNDEQLLALGVLLKTLGETIDSKISGTSMGTTLPAGSRIRIRLLPFAKTASDSILGLLGLLLLAGYAALRSCTQQSRVR